MISADPVQNQKTPVMKKFNFIVKYLLILLLITIACKSNAQYDSIAIGILDSMSYEISDLETCSFRFVSEYDISSKDFGLITHTESGDFYMKGPDKMFVEKKGDKGHKQFIYNGSSFLLYSFDKNQYASVPATMTLIELIDSVSSHYGVEFPGADVFYPDFVDNLLLTSNNLIYLGLTILGNTECYHIAGTTDEFSYQFWIKDDEPSLPLKLSLVYYDDPGSPRYSILFYDWKLNETIEDSKFEFSVPAGAQKIKIIK